MTKIETEIGDLNYWAGCVILGIYRQAILLGLPSRAVADGADEPVMEPFRRVRYHLVLETE